uniref:Cell division control protein 45 homolog n=1 Tax=Caenorhabditis japonica TaxID=281687 RepID=A0A8R1ELS1_CAEJA
MDSRVWLPLIGSRLLPRDINVITQLLANNNKASVSSVGSTGNHSGKPDEKNSKKMILEDNFRRGFYNNIIQGDKSVVLLVAIDTDALCTTMILTHLLRCDDIPFSILVVDGWESVEKIFATAQEQKCYYILINCGANHSLSRLQLPPASIAYVIDSHRPFNIENVYANDQAFMLINSAERADLRLPDADQVMRDDSEDESSDDEDDDGEENGVYSYEQRMEKIQRKAIRREERQLWDRQRRNILWRYNESTWYSSPICVMALELAAEMNRLSAESMWYAAVGLNSALNDKLPEKVVYHRFCHI